MKKIIPLLLIAFIICFAASYIIFSKIIPNDFAQSLRATTITASQKQQTVAFVYVDDLENQKPNLISVWVFFISNSNPLILKFLPLLPTSDLSQTQELASKFSLTDTGGIATSFLTAINDSYQLNLHDYVVLDSDGMALVSQWTLNKKSLIPTKVPMTQTESNKVLSATRKYLQSLCSYIPTTDGSAVPIHWEQLIPDHMRSNLTLEDLYRTLTLIRDQRATVECETVN